MDRDYHQFTQKLLAVFDAVHQLNEVTDELMELIAKELDIDTDALPEIPDVWSAQPLLKPVKSGDPFPHWTIKDRQPSPDGGCDDGLQ